MAQVSTHNGFLEMQPPATLYVKLLILILVRRLIPRIHIQLIYINSNKESEEYQDCARRRPISTLLRLPLGLGTKAWRYDTDVGIILFRISWKPKVKIKMKKRRMECIF